MFCGVDQIFNFMCCAVDEHSHDFFLWMLFDRFCCGGDRKVNILLAECVTTTTCADIFSKFMLLFPFSCCKRTPSSHAHTYMNEWMMNAASSHILLYLFRCVSKIDSFQVLKLDGNEICEEGVAKVTSILLKSGKTLGGKCCLLCVYPVCSYNRVITWCDFIYIYINVHMLCPIYVRVISHGW